MLALRMPSIKALYGILLSGFVFYFLFYSLIVRRLPLVKIFFEDKARNDVFLRQNVAYDSSMKTFKITHERVPLKHDVSSREEKLQNMVDVTREEKQDFKGDIFSFLEGQNMVDVTREEKQDSKGDIFSFLEGLGVSMSKADISPANIPTTSPPRVNPNGASLPRLMKKIDSYLNASKDKACPASHLRKCKSHFYGACIFLGFCKNLIHTFTQKQMQNLTHTNVPVLFKIELKYDEFRQGDSNS